MDNLEVTPPPLMSFGTPKKFIRFWDDETFDVGVAPRYKKLKTDDYSFELEMDDFKGEILIILTLSNWSSGLPVPPWTIFPTVTVCEVFTDHFKALTTYNTLLKITKFKAPELPL